MGNLVLNSMPVRLVFLHFKRNQILLLFWLFLFVIIFRGFGRSLGIPFLFLDPEYMDVVGFRSFMIMGICLAGFSMSFHITTYIKDGPRFNFLGWLERPFMRFSLNNSLIPLTFLISYVYAVIQFQLQNGKDGMEIAIYLSGFFTGYLAMVTFLLIYFWWTNKDIFKYVVCKVDEKLKHTVPVTRAQAMSKLDLARKRQIKVGYYLGFNFRLNAVPDYKGFYDRETVLRVFDQNHLNLISVELIIFVLLLILGVFSDYPVFQIPAASSSVLLLTILIMFTGAFSYWLKGWSVTLFIVALLIFNLLIRYDVIHKDYEAFGLEYRNGKVDYNMDLLDTLNSAVRRQVDKDSTIAVLNLWKEQFQGVPEKPKIVFITASGGGQRSMLWTINALIHADSVTQGTLMRNTRLMTGASGGLVGAAFFRELYYRRDVLREPIDYTNEEILSHVSRENLNPIIFSLLVNDIFFTFQKFNYGGKRYRKDRGYAFEQQLNRNTFQFMDHPLIYYREPEQRAEIPMLIMAPTIINDGRKLFISPSDISYMNRTMGDDMPEKLKGIEFRDFFSAQDADSLRFLSALRMSATFPYITPNITLPSSPPMEIMDAGLTDNFGVSDAVWFLYTFSDWISENTSGVILVNIRDSQKNSPIEERESQSLFQKLFSPIQGFYKNFENIQDISNDNRIESAKKWHKGPIHTVLIEYNSANNKELKERASLNWRLTDREKQSIFQNIHSEKNQAALTRLQVLMGDSTSIFSEN